MFGMTRGALVPARKWLLASISLGSIAAVSITARAEGAKIDVRTAPRLEGAVPGQSAHESYPESHLNYSVPGTLPGTIAAIRKLFLADGWASYVPPLEDASGLLFKKGQQGLSVSFSQASGQSAVSYSNVWITNNLPFPDDATDIVFDENRPYLACFTAATVEASLDLFRSGLTASGWAPLSAAEAAARWPNANLDDRLENGVRAYFKRDFTESGYKQPPVMLALQRRDDGRTSIELKVAPFAEPQDIEANGDIAGLPRPKPIKSFGGTGSVDSARRKLEGTVIAEVPAVLAFYRRELAAQSWKEEATGAIITDNEVTLNFSSPDQDATLRLNHKYDLTIVSLVTRVKDSVLAAHAKAKRDADENFMRDAEATAKRMMAADEVRRAAQAANLSDAPLHALADQTAPVPVPEGAENVKFDGTEGKLEFDSSSSVKALAAFYRGSLKPLGWKEQPSVINKSNMVVMEFSKGGKELSFTAMQMGPKVNVSADGSGLVVANAKSNAKSNAKTAEAANAPVEPLEADPDSALPVPKQHTMRTLGIGKLPGTETAIRRELSASIPAGLTSVLAFYRGEFGKLGWKESADRAVVKPDQIQLVFSSPDGPATLKLGRNAGETTVTLAQKIPAAAAKADIMPKPGQARLMFVNLGDSEAALTINNQIIKIAAGAGGPHAKGPALDLPPGKYQYSLKLAGDPVRSNAIELAADDTWGLMIAPGGEVMPLQMY